MNKKEPTTESRIQPRCCPSGHPIGRANRGFSRRTFLKGMGATAVAGMALGKISWPLPLTEDMDPDAGLIRRPLKVKPILVYDIPSRRPQTSWRSWGGVQTRAAVDEESGRIRGELERLRAAADFPVEFLPLSAVRKAADLSSMADLAGSDAILLYAAGGWMDVLDTLGGMGKDMVVFCRHRSGPVYLWYEIVSPRYLRQHTDAAAVKGVADEDVVIDSQEEILWRLRGLAGLRNTLNTRVLAVGGPDAWSQPAGVVPKLVENIWKFDIRTILYEDLGKLIQAARADGEAVKKAHEQAAAYLSTPGTTLETERSFVENAFLLEQVFRGLMKQADCRAITINGCMGTIMPLAETSACLTLSLLNDAGYLAFCESDFVVIPSGILLANISGRPVFLNDPTYPHEGVITLAHCTAPRKMDGRKRESARILTHFESDYGAAPKVEMSRGQVVTNIVPDFASKRWAGLKGEIADAPFLPICRSQIDIRFTCDSLTMAQRMPGFHWMTGYGDSLRETGYALRRVNIGWDVL
ncbi:MAG TPA: sugar isomerase [Candidatus Aminicenantes bacterium]|nr:sugar isomerase [Candidatus Aminicenantes bacterium]